MSVDVHPRIQERRRQVHEEGAHRRLRWVLALMLLVALAGLGYWLLHSPLLAVERIVVDGDVDREVVLARAADAGLEVGDPIAFVHRGAVAEAVAADPRVAEARVDVRYPGEVTILVVGQRPVAWVDTGEGWLWVTAGGDVVAAAPEPGPGPVVAGAGGGAGPGDTLSDAGVLAGLEFAASLPPELAPAVTIDARDGVLAARVGDHQVALGAPFRMADKAAAVGALVAALDVPSSIDVTTPDRPAATELGPAPPPEDDQSDASVEGEG